MTGTNGPIYRWRVGEVEITRVLEFEAALFEPAVIHPGASSEMIARHRAWLDLSRGSITTSGFARGGIATSGFIRGGFAASTMMRGGRR